MKIDLDKAEIEIIKRDITDKANTLISNATPIEIDMGLAEDAVGFRSAILKKLEGIAPEPVPEPEKPEEEKPEGKEEPKKTGNVASARKVGQ